MNTANLHSVEKLNSIKWGIIGCGNVTEVKSGPAFNKVANSSLVAVMRRDASLAEDYAKRHAVPKWYSHAADLINDPDVNAIYIATPPKQHEEYAIAAMQAGKPVYVEKPMALDLAACRRMEQVSKDTGVKLVVAHYRRALPLFIRVKELLDQQAIGDIRFARISLLQPDQSAMIAKTGTNWRVDPALAGAGLFYDLAPHQLDLLIHFLGKPTSANGLAVNQAGLYTAEDLVVGVAQLPNQVLFNGTWCFTTPEGKEEDLFEIQGSNGSIRFAVFGHALTIERNGIIETEKFDPPQHIQQPMIAKIVQYFLGNTGNPCSAADAIQSMEMMEQFAYGTNQTSK
jgi:predicted dehydrogenase